MHKCLKSTLHENEDTFKKKKKLQGYKCEINVQIFNFTGKEKVAIVQSNKLANRSLKVQVILEKPARVR